MKIELSSEMLFAMTVLAAVAMLVGTLFVFEMTQEALAFYVGPVTEGM